MKITIRILSLLLAILMLSCCFASCKNDDEKETDKFTDTVADTSKDVDEFVSSLPEMDWGGETYRVLARDGQGTPQFNNFEVYYDSLPNDVVGKAVYQRNQNILTKYNIRVEADFAFHVHQEVQVYYETGDDLYDLVIYMPLYIQPHAQAGYLLDIDELPYVDLEHDSWNDYVNGQLTMGGRLFYTTNDFLLQDKHRLHYFFYNRDLARDKNLGYFEDFVDNNTWTLETVAELVKKASVDVDNNGPTNTDVFGFGAENYGHYAVMAFCAGFRIAEIGADGYPKLAGASEKMLNILDETLKITSDKNYAWFTSDYGGGGDSDHPAVMFLDNRILLHNAPGNFLDFITGSNSEIEYGVLPNPKYDSKQEIYCSLPNVHNGSLLAVPYTVANEELAGFGLQAITEESTNTSYTAYIETKCKYQDAYDEDCARMLDLCFDGAIYDIGTICDFGGLYTIVNNNIQEQRKNIYKRIFDTLGTTANRQIKDLKSDYEKIDSRKK